MKKNNNEYKNIPLNLIDENPDNEKIFNMNDISFMAEGIKKEGFIGAITVYMKNDGSGRYEIESGHRRYRAMKLLGNDSIPCIVIEMPDETMQKLHLISSNVRTRTLLPMDMARAIDYYKQALKENKFKGDMTEAVMSFFNISRVQVYRYECLIRIIPELQELADNPDFAYSAFRLAAQLSKENQYELYKILRDMHDQSSEDGEKVPVSRIFIEQTTRQMLNKQKAIEDEQKEKINKNIEGNIENDNAKEMPTKNDEAFPMPMPINDEDNTPDSDAYANDDQYNDFEMIGDSNISENENVSLNSKERMKALDFEIATYFRGLNKIVDSDYFNDKTKIQDYIKQLNKIIEELKKKL